jgi:acyl carrier protein
MSKENIVSYIQHYVAQLLALEAREVQTDVEFASYGLTSSTAIALIGDLEQQLGRELSPALLFEHPTIEAMAEHLASAGGA